MSSSDIACSLDPDDLNRRRADLLPGLIGRAESGESLPDGMRWRYIPAEGLLGDIATVIDAERQCCRFLRFEVVVEADGGPIWLVARGPAGTREYLESLLSRPEGRE
jgi:hypothetical protein